MTTPISGSASGGTCSRPEDDLDTPNASTSSSSASTSKPTSESRSSQSNASSSSSSLDVDWDSMPSAGPSPALAAAGMTQSNAGAPSSAVGTAPETESQSPSPSPSPPKSASAKSPPPKPASPSTNAARTTQRDVHQGVYGEAGVTDDKRNVFFGAAVIKGSTPEGVEVEMGTASVQVGLQNEAQVGAGRAGYQGKYVSGSIESFTASAQAGIDNADGSVGANVGLGATAASIEVTGKYSGSSVTAGLSAGLGMSASIGLRDDDKDGKKEVCVRTAFEFVIAGGCIELPFFVRP